MLRTTSTPAESGAIELRTVTFRFKFTREQLERLRTGSRSPQFVKFVDGLLKRGTS
jgi:hypothetical protein